jgi:IS30 family transposase
VTLKVPLLAELVESYRPRKTLGFMKPSKMLAELVAMTG